MPSMQAVIRYSFSETEEGGRTTNALITASIPGASEASALNYLLKKYPERYNIKIIEVILDHSK